MAGGGAFDTTGLADMRRGIQPTSRSRAMGAPPVPSLPNSGLARFGAGFQPYQMPTYTPPMFQPQALAPMRQLFSPAPMPAQSPYMQPMPGEGGSAEGGFGPSGGSGMSAGDGMGGQGSVGGMGIGSGIGMGVGESMGMSGGTGMSGAGGLGAGLGVGESMGMSGGTGIGMGGGEGGGGGK